MARLVDAFIGILVFCGVGTIWKLVGEAMWNEYVLNQGGTIGVGETFLGLAIPATTTAFVTWFVLRRKNREAD